MQFQLPIQIKSPEARISYRDKIMLTGSCFTEHIGNTLSELKFSVLQNPHGIMFDPASVCRSLVSYIQPKIYEDKDLFQLNEIWHSWDHHSRFSNLDPHQALQHINNSQQRAHDFLKKADWLVITLGSSFSYKLSDEGHGPTGNMVANCHRAPAQWFKKHLMETTDTVSRLEHCISQLLQFNPSLKIIFTVSPVRHIRDGVVENNRSKARLIEAVHTVVNAHEEAWYFPAYELVVDVLRDYRFYDIDMVHPNYAATSFVLDKFIENCIAPDTRALMQEVRQIVIARKHRAFQPGTKAHQQFLSAHFEKAGELMKKYPYLDLKEELIYFSET